MPTNLITQPKVIRLQAVLDALEQPYYQLLKVRQGAEMQVPGPMWQGLQCATALRRLLHPTRLLPLQPQVTTPII